MSLLKCNDHLQSYMFPIVKIILSALLIIFLINRKHFFLIQHPVWRINFDPDAVFGTNVASAFNDDWLNVYANFGWKTGRIDSALTVCLVCSDGHEFEFFYPLTSAEQVQLWNQMDA